MATAAASHVWKLDDLIEHIVQEVIATGKQPHEVIDDMIPVMLRPEDQRAVMRAGLLSYVNGYQGMRGVRSGRRQTVRSVLKSVPEGATLYEAFAELILREQLIFEGADGTMRALMFFTLEDAQLQLHRRVTAPREQSEREEPFWTAVCKTVASGPLVGQSKAKWERIARLAVECRLVEKPAE